MWIKTICKEPTMNHRSVLGNLNNIPGIVDGLSDAMIDEWAKVIQPWGS